eukprot:4738572-Prymnesium_polylepis.1
MRRDGASTERRGLGVVAAAAFAQRGIAHPQVSTPSSTAHKHCTHTHAHAHTPAALMAFGAYSERCLVGCARAVSWDNGPSCECISLQYPARCVCEPA